MAETHLENRKINESSGLGLSWREDGVFWTLNDSGDDARIFAFDASGRHRAEVAIRGAENVDWESMASYRDQAGKGQILLADVGDNATRRKQVTIYRIDEPKFVDEEAKVTQTIKVHYPDGPQNCEAIGVDRDQQCILLIAKAKKFSATVYRIPLQPTKVQAEYEATKIGAAGLPMVTGMDVHPDGSCFVLLTYADAFLYPRKRDAQSGKTDWQATFAQTPKLIPLPWRRQGETVCFDKSGESLWLTSEKVPTPLFNVELTSLPQSNMPQAIKPAKD